MGRPKLSEEEKKQRNRERQAKWYQKNREKKLEQNAKWRAEHKDKIAEKNAKYRAKNPDYQSEYHKTPMGRAVYLVSAHQKEDKKYNRGKCTITAKWVVDNIFSKPCHYCGAMGWEIMGCDRIDNSKPHTPDNVVPCCAKCNRKRGSMSYEEFVEETMYINEKMES